MVTLAKTPKAEIDHLSADYDKDLSRRTGIVVTFSVVFLVFWLASADQYLFFPTLAIWLLNDGRRNLGRLKIPALIAVPISTMVLLSALSIYWTDYVGNAIRTLNVWGTALLFAVAILNGGRSGRSVVIRVLLSIWLMSAAIYGMSKFAPALAGALLQLKITTNLSSSKSFSTPSQFFDLQIDRPIGFALYANELALFGVLIVALYLFHEASQSTILKLSLVFLAFGGLLLSTSRSIVLTYVLVVLFVGLLRLGLRGGVSTLRLLSTIAIITLLVLMLTLYNPDIVGDINRWLDELAGARYGGSARLRDESYSQGFNLFLDNLLGGVGGLPQIADIQVGSHSLPLSVLVRHGIPGGLALAVLLVTGAVLAVRAIFSPSTDSARLGTALIVAILCSVTIQFDDDMLPFLTFVSAATLLGYKNPDAAKERNG